MGKPDAGHIEPLLEALWTSGATDLLLTAESPPLIRVDGQLQPIKGTTPLTAAQTERLVLAVLGREMGEKFHRTRQVDFSVNWHNRGRFRGNAFFQRGTVALAMRLIPFAIPSFAELGLPEVAERFVSQNQGFVLVTGPTGSGKSTTLASMIDRINQQRAAHIVTIEDPIEYVHRHRRSAVNQREVGDDTLSFQDALRGALREDPDVVLVGEMRDPESIGMALTIAETGHLVFATLHTNDTAQALDRIVDVFPSERQPQVRVQLANSLSGIFYQQLFRRIGGGRVAAFEVLVATHAIRNLIREGKSRQIRNLVATGQSEGMQTLEASVSSLVEGGVIDYGEGISRCLFPKEVARPPAFDAVAAPGVAVRSGPASGAVRP